MICMNLVDDITYYFFAHGYCVSVMLGYLLAVLVVYCNEMQLVCLLPHYVFLYNINAYCNICIVLYSTVCVV